MRNFLIAATILLVSAAGAQAAVLTSAVGDVLVNTGSGFRRGVEGQQLNPGDRVMIGRGGGNATISYDIVCLERVNVGRVATVQPNAPCTPETPLEAGVPTGVLIAGGAALAIGGGVLIYNATKGSSP